MKSEVLLQICIWSPLRTLITDLKPLFELLRRIENFQLWRLPEYKDGRSLNLSTYEYTLA